MIDLDELQKLAEAATPGPWTHQPYGPQNQNGDYSGGEVHDGHGEYLFHDVRDEDGAFLVAAQPNAILELIERVRQAEDYGKYWFDIATMAKDQRDAALARIAEAAKLHQPESFHDEPTESFCKTCQRTSGVWPCPTAVSLGLNEGENTDD